MSTRLCPARPSFHVEPLEDRSTPASIAYGAAAGGDPIARLVRPDSGLDELPVLTFDPSFRGGVNVAVGDVTGDGLDDLLVAAGPGGGPVVKVFSGADGGEVRSWLAFDADFRGGVSLAAGDLNADGFADVLVGAGAGGGPRVRAFSGADGSPLLDLMAYDFGFRGGVNVAAGDLDADGHADVVTGSGVGGGPRVRGFSGEDGSPLLDVMAYDPDFRGGVAVAVGDVTGDGRDEVLTGAGPGGGPHVRTLDGLSGAVLAERLAGDPAARGGARVTFADSGSGEPSLLVAAAGSPPAAFSASTLTPTELPAELSGVVVATAGVEVTPGADGRSVYRSLSEAFTAPLAGGNILDVFGSSPVVTAAALRPGDILLSTTDAATSVTIRTATLSAYSHAALYVGNGQVIDATSPGVRRRSLADLSSDAVRVSAMRVGGLSDGVRVKVLEEAGKMVGAKYSTFKLGLLVGSRIPLGGFLFNLLARTDQNNYFCSDLVWQAYNRAGHAIGGSNLPFPQSLIESNFLFGRGEVVGRLDLNAVRGVKARPALSDQTPADFKVFQRAHTPAIAA